MKYRVSWLIVPILAVLLPGTAAADAIDPDIEKSRALAASLGQQLQAELKQSLMDGGPTAAIAVCKDRAPQIASVLSRSSGAKLRRTSLRYRNPLNAPEPWEAGVLQTFEKQQRESPEAPLEYLSRTEDGSIRYMSGIKTGPVCLTCHGEVLAADIEQLLNANYPHDRARGYYAGELRGAFSVTWMADVTETAGGQVEESR